MANEFDSDSYFDFDEYMKGLGDKPVFTSKEYYISGNSDGTQLKILGIKYY